MKTVIKDELNIRNEQIHVSPTRVKVFILNNKNQYVLISAFDGYQLPGGHVENNEDKTNAVIREVHEETGIVLDKSEVPVPFLKVKYYSKTDKNLNRCATIIYYYLKTNKTIDLNNRNLTEHEKENKYSVKCVDKFELEKELNRVASSSPNLGSRVVAEETLFAYNILKDELEKTSSLS